MSQYGLTPRELEIVRSVVLRGHTTVDLIEEFSISKDTVKRHLSTVYDKLGVDSMVKMVHFAIVKGIVSMDELKEIAQRSE